MVFKYIQSHILYSNTIHNVEYTIQIVLWNEIVIPVQSEDELLTVNPARGEATMAADPIFFEKG